jgi:hypothetical protein
MLFSTRRRESSPTSKVTSSVALRSIDANPGLVLLLLKQGGPPTVTPVTNDAVPRFASLTPLFNQLDG